MDIVTPEQRIALWHDAYRLANGKEPPAVTHIDGVYFIENGEDAPEPRTDDDMQWATQWLYEYAEKAGSPSNVH